jgi:nitric oxide reductase NorD protein
MIILSCMLFVHLGSNSERETIYESVRFEQSESEPADRERETASSGPANSARLVPEAVEVGVPVARYPEWDYLISRERGDWATVLEYNPADGRAEQIDSHSRTTSGNRLSHRRARPGS